MTIDEKIAEARAAAAEWDESDYVHRGYRHVPDLIAEIERLRAALKDRDFEWWQACALVDNVAPTPEAVKHWIAVEQEYHVKEAAAAEREACAVIADEVLYWASENFKETQERDRAAAYIARAIRARK